MNKKDSYERRPSIEDIRELKKPKIPKKCVICLSRLRKNIRKLDCNHYFHDSCIEKWEEQTNSCPMCRSAINSSIPIRKLNVEVDEEADLRLAELIFLRTMLPYFESHCLNCRNEVVIPYGCERCGMLVYCSNNCQREGYQLYRCYCAWSNQPDEDEPPPLENEEELPSLSLPLPPRPEI